MTFKHGYLVIENAGGEVLASLLFNEDGELCEVDNGLTLALQPWPTYWTENKAGFEHDRTESGIIYFVSIKDWYN